MSCLSTPLRFLHLLPSELRLSSVLKSGQSFRWQPSSSILATRPLHDHDLEAAEGQGKIAVSDEGWENELEWACGWNDRTIVLRQVASGIYYRSLYPFSPPPYLSSHPYLLDLQSNTTLPLLISYFQLDTKIGPLYEQWKRDDKNFRKKMEGEGQKRFEGIRVLKQDPWEALIAFICSSNNNISRIGLMVNSLCRTLGRPLPHPTAFHPSTIHTAASLLNSPSPPKSKQPTPTPTEYLYSFPPPSTLTSPSIDPLLRSLGFGYRAPYVLATALLLTQLAKENKTTTDGYLSNLCYEVNGMKLEEAREKLMEFKGVGRKVADCVALFGLGYKDVVPVDTHVFQIAIRDYSFPASKSTNLTPILHEKVAKKLQDLWGPYAGWAQQVLFFADLKVSVAADGAEEKVKGRKKAGKGEVVKAKWQIELEEFEAEKLVDGGETIKRRRRNVVKVEKSYVEREEGEGSDGSVAEGDYPTPRSLERFSVKIKTEETSPLKDKRKRVL